MKLFLIDGHALVFKMYYAFLGRPMVNSKGVDTSILFGFTKYLLELIDREKPSHIAVSFDPPGGTFRNQMYPEYKANRSETPQLVIDALEPLTSIVKALDIPVLMIPGFEADDVIGSMALRSAAEGFDVYMVTPDKDYGQLVAPHVWQYKPGKSGSDNEILGEAEVCEKWGIDRTEQVIDILTICGDSSDNVPGVQGVGPVGASKLLGKYGSVDGIYAHLDELTARQQELFRAAQDHISLSRELVTIKTDIPLETTADDMILDLAWTPAVEALFKEFEFPSLIRLVRKIASEVSAASQRMQDGDCRTVAGLVFAGNLSGAAQNSSNGQVFAGNLSGAAPNSSNGQVFAEFLSGRPLAKEVEAAEITDSRVAINLVDDTLYVADSHGVAQGESEQFRQLLADPQRTKVGISLKPQLNALSLKGLAVEGRLEDIELLHYLLNPESSHKLDILAPTFLGIELEDSDAPLQGSLFDDTLYVADSHGVAQGESEQFRQLLADPQRTKVGIALKPQLNALSLKGLEVNGRLEDIELLHYLLNPESSHKLDILAPTFLGIELEDSDAPLQGSLFDDAPSGPDRIKETSVLLPLADALLAAMDRTDARLKSLYDSIEEPLIRVLSRMELAGVKVNLGALQSYADDLREQVTNLEQEIRTLAGEPELNINSPKQVGELLFEKLKLDPRAKKPKKGNWPTDEKTLQELADRSPIIDKILDFRGLRKLLGTYIEPFPSYVSPRDGRVHTTFNQALTATGRLSSSNPNLQNIPIRTEQGREIRKAFVPEGQGTVIMSADYSQIELRIMAHLSGDSHLQEAFREGVDVHAATAAKIFRIPVAQVSSDQRRIAKTANFGIMYGISAFGLAQNLACSRADAKKLIDDYFESFPSIRAWIDGTLAGARANGYVETLLGRRRYVPDVNSGNATVRAFAERNAVNAPIQGTSADIIKLAMAAVDRRIREEGLKSRMVLQIHDELLLEVPENEIDAVSRLLTEEMQGVIKLNVPLTVECNYGSNWLEAH